MGFLKKLVGVFGFGRDDTEQEVMDVDGTVISSSNGDKPRFHETGLPRKGFGVPVQVAVDRSVLGSVLQPSVTGDGGVQGVKWYSRRLKVDEDGDVADEFLEEDDHNISNTKRKAKAAKVRGLMVSSDGKLQQCIEHQGRLLIICTELGILGQIFAFSISNSFMLNKRKRDLIGICVKFNFCIL